MVISSEKFRRKRSLRIPEMNVLLAEEIGLHIGDGSMNYYSGRGFYQLRGHLVDDKAHYIERISFLYKELFNMHIHLREMPSTGVFGFQIWSNELVKFKHEVLGLTLGKKTDIKIPRAIMDNEELAKAFLRGLFDTDGCIYIENKRGKPYPKIQISSVSKLLIEQIVTILSRLGYRVTCHRHDRAKYGWNDLYAVVIRGDVMSERWFSEIRPQNSKHINKFKRWKENKMSPA